MKHANVQCLSVIMPVYNERLTLKEAIRRVLQQKIVQELIVVDDGSKDGSREILRGLVASDPRLRIFFRRRNGGKGAAVRNGIDQAKGQVILIQDSDLEYNPEEYPKLVQPILDGKADVVYGSRFAGGPQRIHLYWHYLGNRLITTLSNIFTNLNLSDMETCYKVFAASWIKQIRLRSPRFGFEPEVTMKLAKCGARFYEVPISYSGRSYQEGKKISYKDGWEALRTLIRYFLLDDMEKKPFSLFRLMDLSTVYPVYLASLIQPYVGRRVLELGAGRGSLTYQLLDREEILTSDWQPFFVNELKRRFALFPHVKVQQLDPNRFKLSTKTDTVLALNVLEKQQDDRSVIRQIAQSLTPGGQAIFLVPAHPALWGTMDRYLQHCRRYDQESLLQKIKGAGLKPLVIREVNRAGYLGWQTTNQTQSIQLRSQLMKLFDLSFHSLERLPLPGLSYLCVASKR